MSSIVNLTESQQQLLRQMTAFFCDPENAQCFAEFQARRGVLITTEKGNLAYVRLTDSGKAKFDAAVKGMTGCN